MNSIQNNQGQAGYIKFRHAVVRQAILASSFADPDRDIRIEILIEATVRLFQKKMYRQCAKAIADLLTEVKKDADLDKHRELNPLFDRIYTTVGFKKESSSTMPWAELNHYLDTAELKLNQKEKPA